MARRKRSHRRGRRNSPRRRRHRVAISAPRRVGRRHRRRAISVNPRHRRRHRRNPPFKVSGRGGIIGNVVQGAVDAGWILAGEAVTNLVAGFIPVTGVAMQAVAKIAGAVAAGYAAGFVSPNGRKMALAGGLASVIRGPVKAAGIPLISANLGDDYLGAYPMAPAVAGVGAYPQALSGSDDEYEYIQQ